MVNIAPTIYPTPTKLSLSQVFQIGVTEKIRANKLTRLSLCRNNLDREETFIIKLLIWNDRKSSLYNQE
jgi:hypothetical protein